MLTSELTIELDAEQAAFMAFCNINYESLKFMAASGVFDIKSGNATLSFDPAGRLKSVKRELFSYQQAQS